MTAVFTHLIPGSGESDDVEVGASSLIDTWILLRNSPPGGQGVGGSQALGQLHALPSTNPLDTADADSEAAERNILAERAIKLIECEFEENTRRAFWQLLQGKKPEEVAADLQMTVQAVYTAKSRVRKRLREEFAGLLDFLPVDEPGGVA